MQSRADRLADLERRIADLDDAFDTARAEPVADLRYLRALASQRHTLRQARDVLTVSETDGTRPR